MTPRQRACRSYFSLCPSCRSCSRVPDLLLSWPDAANDVHSTSCILSALFTLASSNPPTIPSRYTLPPPTVPPGTKPPKMVWDYASPSFLPSWERTFILSDQEEERVQSWEREIPEVKAAPEGSASSGSSRGGRGGGRGGGGRGLWDPHGSSSSQSRGYGTQSGRGGGGRSTAMAGEEVSYRALSSGEYEYQQTVPFREYRSQGMEGGYGEEIGRASCRERV